MSSQKPSRQKETLGKILFYALGLAPDEFGLCLEANGFISIKEVVGALRREEGCRGLTESWLRETVASPAQSQLEIEGQLIRVKPELAELPKPEPALEPRPKLLYLGVKPPAWPVIFQTGLRPKPGQERVHLFTSEELARQVASRFIPEPVLITINKALAEKGGASFWKYTDRIYLASEIAPTALFGPPVKPQETEEKTAPSPTPRAWPGPIAHHGKIKGKRDDAPDWKNQARRDRRRK
ncbi:MAG: RNA 2'-phosphotransferase [Deltaproteobacteria bacterium]|jgi:putative RNA 2'-phosphotransferase|nr:RNA 2'-phosphotransferase [Deltaproteobacteria bacterium]